MGLFLTGFLSSHLLAIHSLEIHLQIQIQILYMSHMGKFTEQQQQNHTEKIK